MSTHTSLSDQQKEPQTPRQVHKQRDRIRRAPEQAQHGPEDQTGLSGKPAPRRVRDRWVGRRRVVDGGFADEGRGETPADSDGEESRDVGYGCGVRGRWRGRVGVHCDQGLQVSCCSLDSVQIGSGGWKVRYPIRYFGEVWELFSDRVGPRVLLGMQTELICTTPRTGALVLR